MIKYYQLAISWLRHFGVIIFSCLAGLFYAKNKHLKEKNSRLKSKVNEQEDFVSKKRKVINAIKKNKPTDVAGNVSRMRKRKM